VTPTAAQIESGSSIAICRRSWCHGDTRIRRRMSLRIRHGDTAVLYLRANTVICVQRQANIKQVHYRWPGISNPATELRPRTM
jgi:hypothetical protein